MDTQSPEFLSALSQAASEHGMADYYEPCVKPLFHMSMTQWPMCCGGRCEPCAQTLITVALRVCELLHINPDTLS